MTDYKKLVGDALQYTFVNFYGKNFNQSKDQSLSPNNRPFYGITHAIGCADLIPEIDKLYQETAIYYQTALDLMAEAFEIDTNDLINLAQITAMFHDVGREGDGPNKPEWRKNAANNLYDFLVARNVPKDLAQLFQLTVLYKDDPKKFNEERYKIPQLAQLPDEQVDYVRQLISMAVDAEEIRMQKEFNAANLPINQLPDNELINPEQLQDEVDEMLKAVVDRLDAERAEHLREKRTIIHKDGSTYEPEGSTQGTLTVETKERLNIRAFNNACARYDVDHMKFKKFASIREDFKGIVRGVTASSEENFNKKMENPERYYAQAPTYSTTGKKTKDAFPDALDYLQTEDVALLARDYQKRNQDKPGYDVNNIFVIEDSSTFLETRELLEQFNEMKEGENLKLLIKVERSSMAMGLHFVPVYIRKVDGQIKVFISDAGAGISYDERDGFDNLTSTILDWAKKASPEDSPPMVIKTSTLVQNDEHNCAIYALKSMKYFVKNGDKLFQSIQEELVSGDDKLMAKDKDISEIHHLKADAMPATLAKLSARDTFEHVSKAYKHLPLHGELSTAYKSSIEPIPEVVEESVRGKELLGKALRSSFEEFYGKKYKNHEEQDKLGLAYRQYHGISHALGCVNLMPKIDRLYQDHVTDYESAMEEIATAFNTDKDQLLTLVEVAAMYHDAGRQGDGDDKWDEESAQNVFDFLKANGFSDSLAKLIELTVLYKDDPKKFMDAALSLPELSDKIEGSKVDYMRQLLNMADTLEVIRCRDTFNCKYLPISTLRAEKVKEPAMLTKKIDDLLDEVTQNR